MVVRVMTIVGLKAITSADARMLKEALPKNEYRSTIYGPRLVGMKALKPDILACD
jgi:hypothetical protein